MMKSNDYTRIDALITQDKKFAFTLVSCLAILTILLNSTFIHLLPVGAVAALVYFIINATFLGNALLREENPLLKILLGGLVLLAFLGLLSWVIVIAYNLSVVGSTLALLLATTLSSLSNRLATSTHLQRTPSPERRSTTRALHFARLIYLISVALLLYLLYTSRADEVYTIWRAVPPTFIPVFFVATLLLVSIVLSSERTELKMLFIVTHSILSLSFYALVFPFGRTGVPQLVLGEIRLIFENIIPVNLPTWPALPAENILVQIYNWIRGYNLESLLNVVFARMFGVDVYWTNLLMIPLAWGIFIPMLAFAIARELRPDDRVSILSSLGVFAFPTLLFWGTFSTHNSLGFIFFYGAVYFVLKHLNSGESKWSALILLLSFASLVSHFLAGIMSFSLVLLSIGFKFYLRSNSKFSREAKTNLILTIIVCASLLPLVLLLNKFFFDMPTSFSLEKSAGYSITEILAFLVLPEYVNTSPLTTLAFGAGPTLGLFGMIYFLKNGSQVSSNETRKSALFLFIAFLIVLIEYRILKLLMINVPFEEERLWVLSDLIAIPFTAVLINLLATSLWQRESNTSNKSASRTLLNTRHAVSRIMIALVLSGWVVISLYHAYPAYSPLQTTTYEVEAVKYIDEHTEERYIVVCDPWVIFAGEMFVGIHNPRAFYFFYQDSDGVELFVRMKNNPSNETLLEAMKHNDASVAYFIIEQLRLGNEEFQSVVLQSQQNGVAVYRTFGDGKLYIYYYKK